LGWSTTNEESYQEGGAHLKKLLMLKDPGDVKGVEFDP
jgi:hypothetical protein